MKLLRKRDIPEEKYSNAFLGYGPEESHFVVELTYSQCAQSLGIPHPPPPSDPCTVQSAVSRFLILLNPFTDYGVDKYDIGEGFGHFGIAVEDVRWRT